ncbi:MAG: sterol desaturase family protein [Alphaproteobacteria bacterium]|nr:sterol desaturase family protein [Alphaproteobacteria bacterium]
MEDAAAVFVENKALVVTVWFVLLFVGERVHAATTAILEEGGREVEWRRDWPRFGRNLGLFVVNALLSPLFVLPISAWAGAHGLGLRPDWWVLVLDIIILDLWIYWWHRANHEVPFLWRFHLVHHLDRFLDTTSAVRFHFGEVFLSALARAPVIIVLDIPFASVVVFETLVLAGAVFHHSNLRLPALVETVLSKVIITPGIHWVHHHRVRRDTDSNYGTIFSFWDPLFRTRSGHRRTADMEIGVEGQDEQPFHDLFVTPFRAAP